MAPLTERQQQAQALTHELQRLGAFVLSPMPLSDDAKLRFQVLDDDREFLLGKISSWGWSPTLQGAVPRFTPQGALPSTIYELDLPRPRQAVVDDRTIKGEIASNKAANAEVEAFKRLRLLS
jgi:hypothetical protein